MPLRCLLSLASPPLCVACEAEANEQQPLCRECRLALHWLPPDFVTLREVAVWAPLAYDGGARAMVRALKFRGAVRLVETMAAQIVANAPKDLLRRAVLVPVPLERSRRRSRGFNQAERLAMAISARSGARLSDCLERTGRRTAQVGLGRAERLTGIAGSIRTAENARVPPEALLVDDVVTTGATLAACAEALRSGGTRVLRAVAFARTPGR